MEQEINEMQSRIEAMKRLTPAKLYARVKGLSPKLPKPIKREVFSPEPVFPRWMNVGTVQTAPVLEIPALDGEVYAADQLTAAQQYVRDFDAANNLHAAPVEWIKVESYA